MKRALVIAAAIVCGMSATASAQQIAKLIYLNRCSGGCDVVASNRDNSLNDESRIPSLNGVTGTSVLSQWRWTDALWDEVVACVTEIYSPYDVEIVTDDPAPAFHHEVMVAGYGTELGYTPQESPGGVAAGGAGCDPADNALSFVFANQSGSARYLCNAVAQESAHSFGLPDHVFDCTDPLSYVAINGGCPDAFFRNKLMPCGEFEARSCMCGGSRTNSHVQLLNVFGAGQDPPPPVTSIGTPQDGAAFNGTLVSVNATDRRGVKHIDVLLNGWPWGTYDQPESILPPYSWPNAYLIDLGDGVPDGIIEIEARASNDLDIVGTATVTVTRGSACTSADTCLEGQRCDEGRCLWDAPAGQLGDACTYDEYCEGPNTFDGVCATEGDLAMCTRACFAGPNDNCSDGFACKPANGVSGEGVCWLPPPSESCTDCSGGSGGTGPVLFGLGVGLLMLRRRRQR